MILSKAILAISSLIVLTSEEVSLSNAEYSFEAESYYLPDSVLSSLCHDKHFSYCSKRGIASIGISLSSYNKHKKSTDYSKKLLYAGLEYFNFGCSNGDGESCYNLGVSYESVPSLFPLTPASKEISNSYYNRSCELGYAPACRVSGNLISLKKSSPKQTLLAKSFFEKGCELGDSSSCNLAGALTFKTSPSHHAKALSLPYYRYSCLMGDKDGCFQYALMLVSSNNHDNFRKAISPLKSSCEAGNSLACYILGMSYLEGIGCKRDLEISSLLFRKACSLGDKNACSENTHNPLSLSR